MGPPKPDATGDSTYTSGPDSTSGGEAGPDEERLALVDPSRYAVLGELARGGLGRIVRARDSRLHRTVALKEMLVPSREAEPRFITEALVTARLQHPAIVPVYEAGRWPGGHAFYAMRLVSGRSLAAAIAQCSTLRERLSLLPHVIAVTDAMAYAHSERIIHRDLKPTNILVGDFGETVVIDWGLAKDLSRTDSPATEEPVSPVPPTADGGALTRAGAVMGTPAYMPPEQALGQPVNERADVYALGALLYHLLGGSRPYDSHSGDQVLQAVVRGPPPSLAEQQKSIPVELLAIVTKAMEREPEKRYATARELAEDLRRFQTGQIVGAHPYSRAQLVYRFARRYQAILTVMGAAALLLLALGTASFRRVLAERDAATEARRQAQAQTDRLLLMQARDAVARDPNEAIAWLRMLSPGFTHWSAVRTIAAAAQAQGLAWVLSGHTQPVNDLAFTRDGRYLVSTSDDHTLRVWDLKTGGNRVLAGHTDEAWRLVLLPDDRRVISSGKDSTLRLWNLETGEGSVFATLSGPVSALALACGGQCVFAASRKDDVLHRWNLETGETQTFRTGIAGVSRLVPFSKGNQVLVRGEPPLGSALGPMEDGRFVPLEAATPVRDGAFSADGQALFTGGDRGQLYRWDTRSGQGRLLREMLSPIAVVDVVPGDLSVAVGSLDGALRLVDARDGRMKELGSYAGFFTDVQSTGDGRYLAAGGSGQSVVLWDLASRFEPRLLRGHRDSIIELRLSPDDRSLATASGDGQVRVYPVQDHFSRVLVEQSHPVRALRLSPDGKRLAALFGEQGWRLLDAASGATLFEGDTDPGVLEFSPDGQWLATRDSEGRLALRNATTGQVDPVLAGRSLALSTLTFSRDSRTVAFADPQGEVRLWEWASGQERVLGGPGPRVFQLAFSPEGGRLACASDDRRVKVWNLKSGEVQVLDGHQEAVQSLAFSPDGKRLVTGSMDHTVRVWDLDSGTSQRQEASGGGVQQVLYSPNGELVASRSHLDGRVRLWDGRTGEDRGTFTGHPGNVLDMAFSPDGTRLATTGFDKTVRLWDLATRENRVLRGHAGPVNTVAFLPDGRSLITSSQDGGIREWRDELPWEPEALRTWMNGITGDVPPSGHPEP